MSLSHEIFLDERRVQKKTGRFSIKLKVYHDGKPMEFETVHSLTKEDWDKLKAPRLAGYLLEVKEAVRDIETGIAPFMTKPADFSFYVLHRDYIYGNPLFSQRKRKFIVAPKVPDAAEFDFTPYHKHFPILTEDHPNRRAISYVYCYIIKQLIREQRIGSALKYRDSYNAIKTYSCNMLFEKIDIPFLRGFEMHHLAKGNSKGSVGITTRHLRAVFNKADAIGIINKENCYPFGRHKYIPPSKMGKKRALPTQELVRIYEAPTTCRNEAYAKALWLFCYWGNGMNPKDLGNLKECNIIGNHLIFDRKKTDLTARNEPLTIRSFLTYDMWDVLQEFGQMNGNPDNYLFPLKMEGLNPLQEVINIRRITRFINDWMVRIGKRLGIEIRLLTKINRQTFATHQKWAGASTEEVQEALGHMDVKTTQVYMAAYEDYVPKKLSQNLVTFKTKKEA